MNRKTTEKLKALQSSPAKFRETVLVEVDNKPRHYATACDDWQLRDCEAIDPALMAVAGHEVENPKMRAWIERPRGHSKTTDLAVMASWLLFASRRKIKIVAAAADRDQAKILRDAIDTLSRFNPWLAELLEVKNYEIENKHTGSVLQVIASDAASSYGLLCDAIICDEVTHWRKRDLFDSLLSTAAKKSTCALIAITNAGFQSEWQWSARELIRTDESWLFRRLEGPQASWIDKKRLAEQERLLPPAAYARLWLNQWASGSGDAMPTEDIEAAFCLEGPSEPQPGQVYSVGVDLGLKRDASAVCLLGKSVGYSRPVTIKRKLPREIRTAMDLGLIDGPPVEETNHEAVLGDGYLRLADLKVWRAKKGGAVDIEAIENQIIEFHRRYRVNAVHVDPWQGEYLIQRLVNQGIHCVGVTFTGNALQRMATQTLDAFRERQVKLYDAEGLRDELACLRIVEKSYGFRLESPRTSRGHGDAATALALAIDAIKGAFWALPIDRPLVLN